MSDQETQLSGPSAGNSGDTPPSDGAGGASREKAVSPLRKLMLRLVHRWFWLSRGMTLGVRAAAFDREGRVFLVRHSYVPGWHLPGGGVERGQSLLDALAMELREEGNIAFDAMPELFNVYFNPSASNRDHVALFVLRDVQQTEPRLPDREIVECGFFALNALPEGITQGSLRRLAEIAGHHPPAPIW